MTDLRARLSTAGISLQPPTSTDDFEPPWFVKALQAGGGWLAAVFLLGFIGSVFLPILTNKTASLLTGSVLIGAAWGLLRAPKNIFLENLVLALSLAGQAMIVVGVFGFTNGWNESLWLMIAGLQVILIIIMQNYVHRCISAFSASIALAFAMADVAQPSVTGSIVLLSAVWLWLHEFDFPAHRRALHATAYGLLAGLLVIQYMARFNVGLGNEQPWLGAWAGELVTGGTLAYVAYRSIQRLDVQRTPAASATIVLALLLLTAASLWAYGLTQGAAILVLGFAISHRGLQAIGTLSLLFSISSYYYLLDATLLHKSLTLAALGSVLLTVRWVINHFQTGTLEELTHA